MLAIHPHHRGSQSAGIQHVAKVGAPKPGEPRITDLRIGRRTPDIYELLLDVEVGSVEQLQRVQAALRATSCVTSVERNLG